MASNKQVFTLDLDASSLVKNYRDAIAQMKAAGAKSSVTDGLIKDLDKIESKLKVLSEEGTFGKTSSADVASYTKKVKAAYESLGELGKRLDGIAKDKDAFPQSELEKFKKSLKEAKETVTKLGEKIVEQGNGIGLDINLDELKSGQKEINKLLEEELKKRQAIEQAAKAAMQDSQRKIMEKAGGEGSRGAQLIRNEDIRATSSNSLGFEEAEIKDMVATMNAGFAAAIRQGKEFDEVWEAGIQASIIDTEEDLNRLLNDAETLKVTLRQIIEARNEALSNDGKIQDYGQAVANREAIGNTSGGTVNFSEGSQAVIQNTTQALTELRAAQEAVNNAEARQTTVEAQNAQAQQNLQNTTNGLAGATRESGAAFEEQGNEVIESAKRAEAAEQAFDNLKNTILTFFSLGSAINFVKKAVTDTLNDVKQLDKSFASIAMVTNNSVGGMWDSYGQYANMASQLGQTTDSVIQASALFYQQGLDTEEALALTTDTMKLATLAGTDFSTATQEMTSAIRGFKMEMDEGGHVADVYSTLAANAAASVDDIAQAMARTASIANSAGMSFENTSAFLTQMIETTQESAENIGTSMKTIIARFTELKTNVAGTSESEFEDLDFNKVDKALKSVGVQLKDTTGQFRNLDEVFLELSGKWDSLDRNTQRYVATIAAGSRQQSRFIAMMDNYDRTVELMDKAADSEGKADEQFAKYADTMEYKLNQLKTQWEEFRVNILDSEFFKGVIDSLNDLVSRLQNVDFKKMIAMAPIAVMSAKTFATNFLKTLQTSFNAAKGIGKVLTKNLGSQLRKLPFAPKLDTVAAQQQINKWNQIVTASKQKYGEINYQVLMDLNGADVSMESLKQRFLDMGFSSQDADAQIIELAKSMGEYWSITDRNGVITEAFKNKLLSAAESVNKQSNALKDSEAQAQKTAASQKLINMTFQSVASAAGMAAAAWISGASTGKEAAKMMCQQLVTIGIQMAVQWVSIAIVNKTGGEAAGRAAGEGFLAGLASTGIGLVLAAIMIAIGAIVGRILSAKKDTEKLKEQEEALNKAMEEAKSQSKDIQSAAKANKDNYESTKALKKEYEELSKKTVKTEEETERWKEIITEIQEQFPEIVTYYNEQNNKLIVANELWDSIIEKQKEVAQHSKDAAFVDTLSEFSDDYIMSNETIKKARYGSNDNSKNARTIAATLSAGTGKYNEYSMETESVNRGDLSKYRDQIVSISSAMFEDINHTETDKNGEEKITNGAIREDWSAEIIKEALNRTVTDADSLESLTTKIDSWVKTSDATEASQIFTGGEIDQIITSLEQYANMSAIDVDSNSEEAKRLAEEENKIRTAHNQELTQLFSQEYSQYHTGVSEAKSLIMGNVMATDYMADDKEISYADIQKVLKAQDDAYANKDYGNKYGTTANGITLGGKDNENLDDLIVSHPTDINKANINGREIEFTDEEIYNWYKETYGDEANEKWANADENTRVAKFLMQKYNEKIKQEAEEAAEEFEKTVNEHPELETALTEILENGSQQADINKFIDLAHELDPTGVLNLDGLIKEYQDSRTAFNEGMEELKNSSQNYQDVDANIGNAMVQHIKDQIESGASREALNNLYNSMTTGLGKQAKEDLITAMNQVDFSKADFSSLSSIKKNWISALKEVKASHGEIITDAEAEEEWKRFFATADKYNTIDIKIKSKAGLEDLGDTISSELAEIVESSGNAASALSSYYEDGYLNFSNYQKLAEELKKVSLDVKDYTTASGQGFTVDVDKLRDAYAKQINDKDLLLQQAKQAVEEGKNELKEEINLLEALKAEGTYNEQNLRILTNKLNITKETARYAMIAANNQEAAAAIAEETIQNPDSNYTVDDTALDALKQQLAELEALTDEELLAYIGTGQLNAALKESNRAFNTLKTSEDKTKKASEDLTKAQEDLAKAQETLNEKLKEYNELLYGEPNRKSSLDVLYNYDEAINTFNDEISRAKELLEDSKDIEDATAALNRYTKATHNMLAEEKAKQQVIEAGLKNYADMIENGSTSYENRETGETVSVNFGDYAKKDERTGKYIIDQRLLNEAKFNDKYKDLIEQNVSDYNKYVDEMLKSEDNVRKAEKELQDERKEALNKYVSMENEIAEALKAKYEEEVNNLKDKYDSMKDADDDYLDALQEAIDKQRELREQDKAFEDLARQEKKLSLMQRDTSGANQVETQQLEKEVQETREDLLNDSIDKVIENLEKLYEKQDELRQEEVELKEALIDNTAFWNAQAEQIAGSFTSAEEYMEYMSELSTEFANMTLAQQQQKLNEYGETFEEASEYMAMQAMDSASQTGDFIVDTMTISGEEISTIVTETAETFTTEVTRSYNETTKTFTEDMKKAEDAIDSAKKSLQEAIDKLNEAAAAYNNLVNGGSDTSGGGGEGGYNPPEVKTPEPQTQTKRPSSLYGIVNSALGVDHNALDDISRKMDGDDESDAMLRAAKGQESKLDSSLVSTILKDGYGGNVSKFQNILEAFGYSKDANGLKSFISAIGEDNYYRFANTALGLGHEGLDRGLSANGLSSSSEAGKEYLLKRMLSAMGINKYATGGLVDYTGPAWVDGSTSRPEAFLSADDTERIGNAAKILADIPWLSRETDESSVTTNNSGNVSVEINLNIDHITSDVDIDEMLERVKEEIVEVARPAGTNTILQQQL